MCGVVAYYAAEPSPMHIDFVKSIVLQSKVRGLHAFGGSYLDADGWLRFGRFHKLGNLLAWLDDMGHLWDCILHARYCTSGDWRKLENNQPVILGKMSLVFNGVISMATKEEMEQQFGYKLSTDNDGELFLRHLENGGSPAEFLGSIKGSFAGAWYDSDGELYAMRNERRPLWYLKLDGAVLMASTRDIFARALGKEVAGRARECAPLHLYRLGDLCA